MPNYESTAPKHLYSVETLGPTRREMLQQTPSGKELLHERSPYSSRDVTDKKDVISRLCVNGFEGNVSKVMGEEDECRGPF